MAVGGNETEYFTGRGQMPSRIVPEESAPKDLSARERAFVERMRQVSDPPEGWAPRLHPDGRVVAEDVLALHRLAQRTNGYGAEVDDADVVG